MHQFHRTTEEPDGLQSMESQMATHSSTGASQWHGGKKFICQCKETRVQSLGQEDTLEEGNLPTFFQFFLSPFDLTQPQFRS